MESVWPVSKLSIESVGSRRELVANCVHTADATQLDSFVASALAVCTGHNADSNNESMTTAFSEITTQYDYHTDSQ